MLENLQIELKTKSSTLTKGNNTIQYTITKTC